MSTNSYFKKRRALRSFLLSASALILILCLIMMLGSGMQARAYAEYSERAQLSPAQSGATTMMDVYGVTRAELVSWLESHENDTYYLSTPYKPADIRSPNGDINTYGEDSDGLEGMNCTGFVWHALCAAHGWRDDIASQLPALSGWRDAIRNRGLETRNFSSKHEMLASGYLEKGDIIWAWDGDMDTLCDTHHIGIFWGSSSSEDRMWHSEGALVNDFWEGRNLISEIRGKAAEPTFTVIKLGGSLYGSFQFMKVSAQPSITNGNACYSLQGAVYGLFDSASKAATHDANQALATYTTDQNGKISSEDNIKIGTYHIAECRAPQGYALSNAVYMLRIEPNKTTTISDGINQPEGTISDAPIVAPPTPLAAKRDLQTKQNRALGASTLEDACFSVSYYDGYYDEGSLPQHATRTWKLRTTEDGSLLCDDRYKIAGDDFYRNADGQMSLPLGTYVINETAPPLGYLNGDGHGAAPHALVQVKLTSTDSTQAKYATPQIFDRVIRGDFSFTKVNGETGEHIGLVPFLITSATTGEAHVIVTDENGMASTAASWNAHSSDPNANDVLLSELENDGRIASEHIDTRCGIWFAGATETSCPVNDAVGALPYDTYHVNELPCDTNSGYSLASFDVYLTRESTELNLGTVDDNPLAEPVLDTYLTHSTGLKLFTASDTTRISDEIYFMNLDPDETYTIDGELHIVTDEGEDGGLVAQSQAEFSPTLAIGETRVTFELDTLALEGKKLVAFETVSDSTGVVLAEHDDPTYEPQTVFVDGPEEVPPPTTHEPDPEPEPEPEPDPEPQPEEDAPQESIKKEMPIMGDYSLIIPLSVAALIALICIIIAYKMKGRRSTGDLVIAKGPARSEFEEWYRSIQEENSRRSESPEFDFRF